MLEYKQEGQISISVQEKQFKYIQADVCGGHLRFLIGKILAIIDLQIRLILITKFPVNLPFGLGNSGSSK